MNNIANANAPELKTIWNVIEPIRNELYNKRPTKLGIMGYRYVVHGFINFAKGRSVEDFRKNVQLVRPKAQ